MEDELKEINVYDEVFKDQNTLDLSNQGFETLPSVKNTSLCMVYLQNNNLTALPDDFFPSLPTLMWLDLRDNKLTDIPKTIKNHQTLTHLLLQNNLITSLPEELGTLHLKVLQLNGNPLMFPPREILNAGVSKIISFLHGKYLETANKAHSEISEDNISLHDVSENHSNADIRSYNSVIDGSKLKKNKPFVQFSEKDFTEEDEDEIYYAKFKGKCPKLANSRYKAIPAYFQSAKYVQPVTTEKFSTRTEKLKNSYFKELTLKKHKELFNMREKILQDRKNLEQLKNWRRNYRNGQSINRSDFKLNPNNFPYDTNPEFMSLLSREDIEKDLPDKFKKKLLRKTKPSVPRKSNNDVHLAMKIKHLFDNLEAIDLNRETMTPRTEQKMLLTEIEKITEIKQKLMELSTNNTRSVVQD